MEPTMMFLGNYPIAAISSGGYVYDVPLAFILVFIAVYIVCFIMMMQYSSEGVYEALMTQMDLSARFANDVFCGWDYSIGNAKSAELHHRNFTYNIKSALSEITYRKQADARSRQEWIKLCCIRIAVNLLILLWIAGCYYAISYAVRMELRQENQPYEPGFKTLLIQFLPAISVTTVRITSPYIFEFIAQFEKFHARIALNLSLMRCTFVGLSSIFVMVASFYHQITCQPVDVCGKGEDHCHSPVCWETYVGQELYKLNISEFFVSLFFFFLCIARHYLATKGSFAVMKWIGSAEFILPIEILTLIYLQTITWLGVLYSPLLPVVLIIKLFILFYIKKVTVMKYTKPSTTIYKGSRFNSMYIFLLMISFLIVLAIQFYAMTGVFPSYGCSPFRFYDAMSAAVMDQMRKIPYFSVVYNLIFTKWIFLPVYILQGFLIYYYFRQCSIMKDLEQKLKDDLVLLENDKQFVLQKLASIVNNKDE